MSKSKKDVKEEIKKAEEELIETTQNPPDKFAGDISAGGVSRFVAVCRTACTFRGRYWAAGQTYRGAVRPPEHFEVIVSTHAQ